ncbi:hypothetical protein NVP1139A_42 [Vibrio phage 1.139.A._10N.261.48.C6]|nr:hypothetical protein NVP1034O_41 [Vibrio phage 1.034.O._10N.261.46.B7]AUR83472.1 hypothetical protein NVP1034X_42 [Vibrio phage 1.034.X._10N.261.46.B7]AUR90210.1 hypothetical protein NVP1139A_42 [Vibrio phage 1.139.A._10N.261.48.C6]AUR90277.1 hypothetical protein NVP1139B_42 [Vibrio phage 1.139.B._10N.261.48.C6]AUR95598.1 hypothetical protein NVP1209O_41 [Vibrio phage 1.209.O._10N.222.52.B2]
MNQVTGGYVQKITTRSVAGNKTAYNLKMDDGQWYGHGFAVPQFGEGAEIEFSFSVSPDGRFKNIDTKAGVTIHQQGQSAPPQQAPQQQGGYRPQGQQQQGGYHRRPQGQAPANRAPAPSGGVAGKDDYWNKRAEDDKKRQKCIEYQSSRNTAVELVGHLLKAELVALPTKKADKMDAVLALVDTLTDRYVGDVDAINTGRNPRDAMAGMSEMEQPGDFEDPNPQQHAQQDDDIPFE